MGKSKSLAWILHDLSCYDTKVSTTSKNAETVMEEGYQLTDNDIVQVIKKHNSSIMHEIHIYASYLQARVKTIGINEYHFEIMSKKGVLERKIIMVKFRALFY